MFIFVSANQTWSRLLSCQPEKTTKHGSVEAIQHYYVITFLNKLKLHNKVKNKGFADCFHQGTFNNPQRLKGTCIRLDWSLFHEGVTIARHVMHLLSSIFSPADNSKLWQDMFLLSYAEWERSCLGKWPGSPAERKGAIAAGRQQADSISECHFFFTPPPSLTLSSFLFLSLFYLPVVWINQRAGGCPAFLPCHPLSMTDEESRVLGTWGEGVESKQWPCILPCCC